MSPEQRATLADLARLRDELAQDRAILQRREAEARQVMAAWQPEPPEQPWLALGAVAIHAWYTGLETILERSGRILERTLPQGEQWHRELLSQAMTEIPGVRPAILPRRLQDELRRLLGFRHFFRHAYGAELDPLRLRADLERLLEVAPQVDAALGAFDGFLAQTIRLLGHGDQG